MDSGPEVGVPVGTALEENGKRPVTEEGEGGASTKRIKGVYSGIGEDVKKVAEIVLVLAAMGKMRGGKGPSDVEKELMEAARIRLAQVCEGFSPKDVFPTEVFGGLIEDLGLNNVKEQKLGFRPPKISIAEKLLASKKKMEKADEFALASAHSSLILENSSHTADSRSGLHPLRVSSSDKPMHSSIPCGTLQPGHNSAANSGSLSYQLPTSEIRPIPLSGSDKRYHVSSHPSQAQANYSGNSMVKTSTWQVQHHAAVSSNLGSDAKGSLHMPVKNEGVHRSGFVHQTASRSFSPQTMGGMQSQSVNAVQAFSLRKTHSEIVKIVQKLLQPRATESPSWDPPSRDYMNKALTCQICMSMATDVDSILICDACEKGYHYAKCLLMKEVPRVEWHCPKCLSLSNGKPLPPKYGRVMRNSNTAKMPSGSDTAPASSSVRSDTSDEKLSSPKTLVNGSNVPGNSCTVTTVNQRISESSDGPDMLGSNEISLDSSPNSFMKPSNPGHTSIVNPLDGTSVGMGADAQPNPSAEHVNFRDSSVSAKQSHENHAMLIDSRELQQSESSNSRDLLNNKEALQEYPSDIYANSSNINQERSSGNAAIHAIMWIGGPVRVSEENYFYTSCFVNGHSYRTMDHALIHFDNDKIIPAKIQAFWEDKSTATKWVTANQCYFPDDLPDSVGRPCGLENNEVCESTRSHSCLVGSIEGPCLVLPPRKFAEESERRARFAEQPNDHLPPLYLCKWVYDETKGLFRDASL